MANDGISRVKQAVAKLLKPFFYYSTLFEIKHRGSHRAKRAVYGVIVALVAALSFGALYTAFIIAAAAREQR